MAKDKTQMPLFESLDDQTKWREEWKGMPEFSHEDAQAFQKIIVNFKTREDVMAFAKLIEQKLTYKTASIWYPKANYAPKQIYKDEQP